MSLDGEYRRCSFQQRARCPSRDLLPGPRVAELRDSSALQFIKPDFPGKDSADDEFGPVMCTEQLAGLGQVAIDRARREIELSRDFLVRQPAAGQRDTIARSWMQSRGRRRLGPPSDDAARGLEGKDPDDLHRSQEASSLFGITHARHRTGSHAMVEEHARHGDALVQT